MNTNPFILNSTCLLLGNKIECINKMMMLVIDGWATDDLVYVWQNNNPVQIGKVSLPRFVIEKYSSDYCNVNTSTGNYNNNFIKLH